MMLCISIKGVKKIKLAAGLMEGLQVVAVLVFLYHGGLGK